MPLVALVCASLLGLTADEIASTPTDVVAQYTQLKARLGRGSEDQVRLALWCEAHGLTAERARHLSLAVLADPGNATARGLAGLVARNGRWVRPDSVAKAVQDDPAAAALRAEYDAKRSKTAYTADSQWSLGLWADEHGLPDQARAHFTAVTRLDPSREVAWKRLGYKKHDGQWTTDAQLAANKAESDAQQAADKTWRPLLEKWKGMLTRPSRQAEAQAALLGVTDPRAVPAIGTVFGDRTLANQLIRVQLLSQIEGAPASLGLAELAVQGQSTEVRRVALETLTLRDPRDFMGALVHLVRTPWKYEVRPVNGPGSTGELFMEGERYNVRRLYQPPPMSLFNTGQRIFDASVPFNAGPIAPENLLAASIQSQASLNNVWNGRGPGVGGLSGLNAIILNYNVAAAQRDFAIQQNLQGLQKDVQLAQFALESNIRDLEAVNTSIRALNDRVLPVLAKVTGQQLGEDSEAWARWHTEQAGYAFQSISEKPTFTEVVPLAYQSQPPHAACFGAGTTVRTIDGSKPIEEIRRGDQVLVEDTINGALSYQPVMTAFHNPPNATLRVKLGDDEIVATGIHRFWKAGHGWTMARDLKVGDPLRVLGGVASVASVEPNTTQPVFNLEVAEGKSFFVGRLGTLVHDNSLVEATPEPFDGVRTLAKLNDKP